LQREYNENLLLQLKTNIGKTKHTCTDEHVSALKLLISLDAPAVHW